MIINQTAAGGLGINGIIEQYKVQAGANISAGDFVEFVNNYNSAPFTTVGSSVTSSIAAATVSGNNVLVAYGNSNYLWYLIVTVNGDTITQGTIKQASISYGFTQKTQMIVLSETSVCLLYCSSSFFHLCGAMFTINGTTVSMSSVKTVISGAAQYFSAVKLSGNRIFVAHVYNNDESSIYDRLRGVVLTISGTSITAGTAVNLLAVNYTGRNVSAVALSDTSVFIAHSANSYPRLNGMIVTINGTTCTAGPDTEISTVNYSAIGCSAILTSDNKIFIVHRNTNSTGNLFALVCTVSGAAISVSIPDTQITNTTAGGLKAIELPDKSFSVVYVESVKVISGSSITNKTTMSCVNLSAAGDRLHVNFDGQIREIGGAAGMNCRMFDMVWLGDGKLFEVRSTAASDTTNGYCAMATDMNEYVKYPELVKRCADAISGIANTAGTGGQMIEVYVPMPILTLIVKTTDMDGYGGITVTCPDGTVLESSDAGTVEFKVSQYGTYNVVGDYGHEGDVTGSATFVAGGATTITVNVEF